MEELGLKNVKKNCQVFAGGSSSTCATEIAASLINSGAASTILFVHADRLGTGVSLQGGIDLFATAGISAEWEVPYGQHYSSIAALSTMRYKYETGCTDEQTGGCLCVEPEVGLAESQCVFPEAVDNGRSDGLEDAVDAAAGEDVEHAVRRRLCLYYDVGGACPGPYG
ncbi:MAG: hypothetical protein MZV70_38070 [Desulfobacterales bacterium]|nr:hypothetical protein [Desulfobacterales bacterium]